MTVKHILRRNWVRAVLCAVLAGYIRLVHLTSRWQTLNGDIPARLWDKGQPFLVAFWHGRLMMMPYSWRKGVPTRMLISQHPDGQFIAHTIRHFGFESISGSSTRGGSAAMRAVLRALHGGACVGFTPDGPRGPRMRASIGIVQAARLAGVPILPFALAVKRRRVLGSWDRFILALPFTRGVFIWGQPIAVARHASETEIETARQLVEDRLNALTAEADRLVGTEPVMPAEPVAGQGAGHDGDHDGTPNEGAPRAMTGRP